MNTMMRWFSDKPGSDDGHAINAAARSLAMLLLLLIWTTPTWSQPPEAPSGTPTQTNPEPAADTDPVVPATADLRPHFTEGQSARYSLWTLRDQTLTMHLAGREQALSSRMEINGEILWQVQRVDQSGGAECVMTMHWMSATLTMPDGSVQQVDTRLGPSEPLRVHQLMSAMVNVPLQVTVAADGSVQAVHGVDAMRQRAGQDITIPEEIDFMESASELALIPFAPPALNVGQSFPAQFTWSHEVGRMHYQTQSTLQAIELIAGIPVATVASRSQMQLQPDPAQLPADGPPMDIRLLSGDAQSQVLFDLTRHEAVGRNSIETRRIQVQVQLPNQTLVRTTDERIQSQALRIAEH